MSLKEKPREKEELLCLNLFLPSLPSLSGRVPRRDPPSGPLRRLPGRVLPRAQPVLPKRVPGDRQAHVRRVRELGERQGDGERLVKLFCSVLVFFFGFAFPPLFLPAPLAVSSFRLFFLSVKATTTTNEIVLRTKGKKSIGMEGAYKKKSFVCFSPFSGKGSFVSLSLSLPSSSPPLFFYWYKN